VAIVLLLVAAAAVVAWIATSPRRVSAEIARAVSGPGEAAAGRRVFFIAGCASCHKSPGQDDPLRLGGGLLLKTPFGDFYPPNISSDANDGIGAWSSADLANTLMEGVSPRGEHLYPALPYPSYHRMAIKDVRDLFAFLKTVPPAAGRAPPHDLRFPFSIRRAVGFWKLLELPSAGEPPTAEPTGRDELGRYLVEGPGHCAECHSPRNWLGGIIAGRRLTGGPLPAGKGKAPDITAAGLADWSESDVADALSTGFTPTGDTLGGAMAEVVRNLAQATPDDRAAIAHYLKTYRAPPS
jgi:mono/diheme cytochrome c family protein